MKLLSRVRILQPSGVQYQGRNMLHWNNRLAIAIAAALITISAFVGEGWTWH